MFCRCLGQQKKMINIYVGNLPYSMTDADLEDLFAEFGAVQSAKVIIDRDTNRSKGFGFVEMEEEGGREAIDALNDSPAQGRPLRVNEARPREERPPRSGGGGGFRGGDRRGGGGGGFRGGDRRGGERRGGGSFR